MLPEEAYALAYTEIVEGRFDRFFTDSKQAEEFLEVQMRSHLTEEIRAAIRERVKKARAVVSPVKE